MDGRTLREQAAVPAAAAAAFAALAVLHLAGLGGLYDRILGAWGVVPFDFPFVDIHGVLSAIQCSARGINVYVTNPCDILGRVFFYSPLLLWAAPTGIGVAATVAAGLIVDVAFILSLSLLPIPSTSFGRCLLFGAALSSAVALGLERANIDLLIFAVVMIGGRLLLRGGRARLGAHVLFGAVALLKFYPAVIFALAWRERPRRFLAIAAAAATAGAVFVVTYGGELALALANVPHDKWFQDMFGARDLPYGLAALGLCSAPGAQFAALAVTAGIGATVLGLSRATDAYRQLAAADAILLIIGAAIVVGCFFAGQSYAYRSVFLIMTVPGLAAMSRYATARAPRWLFAVTSVAVVLLMWEEALRHVVATALPGALFSFWLGRELMWWAVVVVLGGVLIRFVRSTEIASSLAAVRLNALARQFSAR